MGPRTTGLGSLSARSNRSMTWLRMRMASASDLNSKAAAWMSLIPTKLETAPSASTK